MLGDKLIIKEHHTRAAGEIAEIIKPRVHASPGRYAVAVGGESGCGKSETAHELARFLGEAGFPAVIFAQDDYFVYPPRTNHEKRVEDVNWVGPGEVRLGLLDDHIALARDPNTTEIVKPLSVFNEDRLGEETVDLTGVRAVIAEGTYTNSLQNADCRVFIDRTYHDTLEAREERARDKLDDFSERVLAIEHGIIKVHRTLADIIIKKDYSVEVVSDEFFGENE
jgi:uridine kinase